MEKITNLFLVAILALISVNSNILIVDAKSWSYSYKSISGAGCPRDPARCEQACKPCYSGIGKIVAKCDQTPGTPYPECRCYFVDGAPYPLPAGRIPCPYMPPSTTLEGVDHLIGHNGTKPSA